ncbi:acetoacetate decarboxylase family protein [Novosphingobium sp. BL-52-GroH]|uniref:acetoacetate decarboxylase family protein n=1 Tax=Novosphingobium sp. BL-52-GroH TaxID=3349877 RepID=UPI00384C723C
MTQGFTRPFTPSGNAAMAHALPWKFAGDLLLIHFRAAPEALARYLPEPLEPLDDSGECFLWSPRLTCHPVDMDPATMDPGQTGYNVCVIGIPARLNGEPTMFSAFQWCDKDWLIVLSWFIGATSKGAEFQDTSRHELIGRIGSPLDGAFGHPIRRTVSRFGNRVVDMGYTPEREIAMDALSFYTALLPLTGMRHMPDLTIPPSGRPPVHDLVQQIMRDTSFGTPTTGPATLKFGEGPNEELLPIQPLETIAGYSIPMTMVLEGIRVVHDYNARS